MLHGMPDGSIGATHEDRYTKYYPGVPGKPDQFIGTPYVIFEVIAALKVSSSLSVHR